ncbi:aldo/keto reductase [Deinococcus sp. QL22]|uniref:aldo/keto reductase n=1 Tax=Deinococcus sp. QL22 TaxID=2939437 RepID=UPI002017D58A|nr:aldo/keto reductase [Deinococcus sp. QL22]UQN05229.1 aldo/keto reductase [Deinococcus sp. QL22]
MTALETRLLGANLPTVTRLGLGLAALGRPGYINVGHGADLGPEKSVEAMRANAHVMLDEAWAAGIRYFDAARSYGLAEEFLGSWLADRGYDTTVGSKWGYTYTANWRTDAAQHEVKDHTRPTLERQWPETLAALRRTPDLYLIHSATLETGVLDDLAVLARLVELADSGVRVGLSLSGPAQADTLQRALDVRLDGVNPLSVVQATWNLLESSVGAALAEAHAAGWGVVVKEAVANGRLSARGSVPQSITDLCARLHTTPDALALAAALAQPWADTVLSGAATQQHLHSNLSALNLKLGPEELDALQDAAQTPAAYWQERAGMAWN